MSEKSIHGFLAHVVGFFAVAAPALMGSVHPLARTVLIFGGFFCFFTAIASAGRRHSRVSLPLVFLLMLVMGFVGLLQCIPLPVGWLEILSPHLADLQGRLGHSAAPLAYDTPAALMEAFELLSMAGFLFAAYQVTREGTHTQRMVQIIGFGGALLAAVAFFHHFAGVSRMYGLYEPQMSRSFFVPFVNSNHAAGYYAFIFFVLLSLGIAEPGMRLRIFTLSAAALPFLAVLWTGSRAGIAALGAGVVIWRVFNGFSRDTAESGTDAFLVIMGILVAIPLMDFFVTPFLQTPAGLDEDVKVRMWAIAWPLVRDHAWTGIGPGSFSSVFPYYHDFSDHVHMDYAENIAIQFAADYGIVLAFLAGTACLILCVRYLRLIRMRAWKAGLLAAVATLGLQNLFDFNLEFPGTALPFFVVLGVLSAQRYHDAYGQKIKKYLFRPATLWVPGVLLSAGAVFAVPLYAVPYELEKERAKVIDWSHQRKWPEMAAAAARAQKRHPADAMLAAARGFAETFVPRGTPLRWIGLASWLYPRHPYPDLMAARVLAAWKRPQQALLQYRLALEKGAPLNLRLVQEIRPLLSGKQAITDVVPPRAWNALVPLLPGQERIPVCRVVLESGVPQLPCVQLLMREALRQKDWAFIVRLSALEEGLSGSSPRVAALRLRALHEQGLHGEFETHLQEAIRRHPRSGVMKAASMMLLCRLRGLPEALKWARDRVDSRELAPAQAFFLVQAALRLQDSDTAEAVFWRRRLDLLASAGKAAGDAEAFQLLDFLWTPAFCGDSKPEAPAETDMKK